ncbi:metallophosphoesterase [Haloimpatiens sp. FM7315]|uniref:metallophosphoesterase n=1 Tax=Haloimpatiens sp. FM7315 TaxID=3298609 RepID=UPI00370C3E6D
MYENPRFYKDTDEHFVLKTTKEIFKILQLTDLHLGFGIFSKNQDKLAMEAVKKIIKKSKPNLIILTGDSIFPYIIKSGTRNNIKEAKKLVEFMDTFKIPYAFLFGNHDIEMGSKGSKEEISDIIIKGKYSIFNKGLNKLTGVGNYIIKLVNEENKIITALVILDSNMYRNGWFFSGFDCIHKDQTDWCMENLSRLKYENPDLFALAFFHMPLPEFKEAYEKMKLGDRSVEYNFGSIGESNDYFGISKYECEFFNKVLLNKTIKGIFCGHDHLNTLSLTYKGIMMTYGMSIDYLGYSKIGKRYTQRGGTLIEVNPHGSFRAVPIPLTTVVSKFVRGKKNV